MAFKLFSPNARARNLLKTNCKQIFQDLGNRKRPKIGSLGALNPAMEKIICRKPWIPQTWWWPRDAPVVYFVLRAVCWTEGSFSWTCPSALHVHHACCRQSSTPFSSAVLGFFKNRRETAASCKAQKQMVQLKSKGLFWDKAAGSSWNLLHMLL